MPRIDAGVGAARGQPSQVAPGLPDGVDIPAYEVYRARLEASYDADVFGRLRDAERAAVFDAEAEAALYGAALLAVEADVVETYFLLRQAQAEGAVEAASVRTREEAVALLERRVAAGDISDLDLARTRSELESARADVIALERRAQQYENALALLCGTTAATLTVAAAALPETLPGVPAGVPSTLLERRPDIAEAQRRMQAATARIGIAKAAFYPVLNITASFGTEASDLANLSKWSSRTWALGPLSGALLLAPLFDGGRNKANLERAYANLDAEIARYRATVLGAFREVEDSLVGLDTLARQSDAIAAAQAAAERAYQVALARYEAGQTAYLDVLDARRTLVAVRRTEAALRGERALSTVALARALGGGWAAQ